MQNNHNNNNNSSRKPILIMEIVNKIGRRKKNKLLIRVQADKHQEIQINNRKIKFKA